MKCKDCEYYTISLIAKGQYYCSNYKIKTMYVEPNDECHGTTSENLP